MKPVSVIDSISTAAVMFGYFLGTGCGLVGGTSPDLRIFDYKDGKVVATIPAKKYREIPCDGPLVQGFFFTMTREGGELVLRKRDKDGNEAHRYKLPLFSSVFHDPHLFSVSRDGKKIAYWSSDERDLHVRDLESANDRIVFSGRNPEASCDLLDWTPGGRLIVAIGDENDVDRPTVHMIAPNGDVKSREFKGIETMYPYMCVSPDGQWICAILDRVPALTQGWTPGDQVALIDLETLTIKHKIPHSKADQSIYVIRWAANSKAVSFIVKPDAGHGGDVFIYDMGKKLMKKIIGGPEIGGIIGSVSNEIMVSEKEGFRLYDYIDATWTDAKHQPDGVAVRWIPGTTRLVIID
ncbi:MAG: hypothetical protein K9N23_20635 [Akkermansiaceae bacterium]|nr:hypothetical protein [Akkermansiaceae bacterium]MCF7734103.1 hypothetical protein [Akkermansiaceae bacterium]